MIKAIMRAVRRPSIAAALAVAIAGPAAMALTSGGIPAKITITWGTNAPGANITCPPPNTSQIGIANGRASYPDGFPPLTFQPAGAGGVPPSGADFNGVLCHFSQWLQWYQAGAQVPYDATFQAAVGGYPRNAVVGSVTTPGAYWQSTVESNVTNPDTGGAGWTPWPPTQLCGAVGLRIANDGSFPATRVDLTADQVTTITPGGQTISRFNVSLVLNFSINGAGGLDGFGSFTGPNWYHVYVIDNGSGQALLGSLSGTAPAMPPGYTYKCRLGTVRADSTPNLLRIVQVGAHSQVLGTQSVPGAILVISGQGTSSGCSGATPTWQNVNTQLQSALPPNATWGDFILWGNYNNGGGFALVLLAPNATTYGGTGTATATPAFTGQYNATFGVPLSSRMMLETPQTAFYCGNGSDSSLWVTGWTDKVNASWLLRRDLDPAANDDSPAWLAAAA